MTRICIAIVLASSVLPHGRAAEAPTNTQLLKRIEDLEAEVKYLRQNSPADAVPQPGAAEHKRPLESFANSVAKEISLGAYGETKIRSRDGATRWDPHRLVLLPTYQFNDWIVLNAEIEFEHGGSSTDSSSKTFEGGNIEVEQLYVDFQFTDWLAWRAPGIDLVPVGYFNLHHEPTQFYSTERPPIYRELIPSTWFEMSTGLYGQITEGLRYQLQISSGLDDDGDNTKGAGSKPGITFDGGLRGARPAVGDFAQSNDALGYAFRLAYDPPALRGLGASASFYYTDTTPERGGSDNPNFGASTAFDHDPRALGGTGVFIYDAEFRYRIPRTPVELRGEYVFVDLDRPHNLVSNNDGDFDNNVGSHMQGISGEIALHLWPESWNTDRGEGMDLVPFFRYTRLDIQNPYAGGSDENDFDPEASPESPDRHVFELGLCWLPTPELAVKFDWKGERFDGGTGRDTYQMAIGFFF
ncbi:MAG TPA: hypothetical protein PLU30_08045 [Verrucomicrobiae bacterium]|nr:hypothetical protein [Verrucomicrobiae bacterium]